MKLNPPETAPKDALILAAFGTELHPAVWNEHRLIWMIVEVSTVFCPSRYWYELEIDEREREEIAGWLPMPIIDGKGNFI